MNENKEQKLELRNIPGMRSRERFVEVQHAQDVKTTLKRIVSYFVKERRLVLCMLAAVVFGTLCGVCAPSLQSKAIDIIAGSRSGSLIKMLLLMLSVYLLYSASQLLQ